MRVFFAADLREDVVHEIDALVTRFKKLDGSVKWVKPENHHITIYFFGEADENTRQSIEGILAEATTALKPFPVLIRKVSAFPSLEHPRVLWVGIENPGGELGTLYSAIQRGIGEKKLPVNREERGYTPHLTIGRVKFPCSEALVREVRAGERMEFGEFEVKSLALYQSTLRSTGPVYTPLSTYNLG